MFDHYVHFKRITANWCGMVFILVFSLGMIGCKPTTGCMTPQAANYNPNATEDDGSCTFTTPYSIGQSYQGGIIFYVDGSGQHGLIASTTDVSSGLTWSNGSIVWTYSFNGAVGAGSTNTINIVSLEGVGNYAAYNCETLILNGYNDWFLPSREELYLLYVSRNAIGGFGNNYYWSSTESDAIFSPSHTTAYCQRFNDGLLSQFSKDSICAVRPIRSF